MSSGKATDYYKIRCKDGYIDVDEIAKELNLTFFEGNVLKAIFGIAKARETGSIRHNGTSIRRDANKLVHYAQRVKEHITGGVEFKKLEIKKNDEDSYTVEVEMFDSGSAVIDIDFTDSGNAEFTEQIDKMSPMLEIFLNTLYKRTYILEYLSDLKKTI